MMRESTLRVKIARGKLLRSLEDNTASLFLKLSSQHFEPMHRTPVIKRRRSELSQSSSNRGQSSRDSLTLQQRPYRKISSYDGFGSTEDKIGEVDDSESIISSECHGGDADGEAHQPSLQVQEIWPRQEISKGLSEMPGSQEIFTMLDNGNLEAALSHSESGKVGLLLASWMGFHAYLQQLLQGGTPTTARDSVGRTALHLSACAGSNDCVTALLSFGAETEVWDLQMIATPLHCAASVGSLECLRQLLRAGANIEAGLSQAGGGKPPLHYAIQSNAIHCVQELISNGAQVNMTQAYSETPLHVAAGLGFAECVKILLAHGADYRVQFGDNRSTPLHLAAEDGNAECARLLLEAGADINKTTSKNQTPLHLAALAQSVKTLELLLNMKSNPNAKDKQKRTPLHCAIVKVSRSCECVQLLLEHGAEVNAADEYGYTPVHLAALNNFTSCLRILLDYGGDVTKKTNGNIAALSFIARRTPEILRHLETKLDQAIKLYDHEIGDTNCEVQLDFRILVPDIRMGETALLLTFIEVGQRRLLRHPLCETFLHLKWRRIRKFFFASLILHAVYVMLCSIYIIDVFLADEYPSELSEGDLFLNVVLVMCNLSILCKELFQIAHSRLGYIYHWENWLQWLIIITIFITLVPPSALTKELALIQHHITVFGMFFNWIELMVLMGRFPMFGIYVQMFTTGAVNFGKFLLAYCCLLLAFAFSFRMIFPRYNAFKAIPVSIVKTVVMMTGELEFEDIFFPDATHTRFVFAANKNVPYPGTAHVFFLLFTLIVTTVLTNLLVGLSVSDIQGLQRSAGLERLARQVELVAYMESMLFSRLLDWLPATMHAWLRGSATLLSSRRQCTLIVRPNDPRGNRIPDDLVQSIYKNIAERKPIRTKGKDSRRRDAGRKSPNHRNSVTSC